MSSDDQAAEHTAVISAAHDIAPIQLTDYSPSEHFNNAQQEDSSIEQQAPIEAEWHYQMDEPSIGGASGPTLGTAISVDASASYRQQSQDTQITTKVDPLLDNPIQTNVSLMNDFQNNNKF